MRNQKAHANITLKVVEIIKKTIGKATFMPTITIKHYYILLKIPVGLYDST